MKSNSAKGKDGTDNTIYWLISQRTNDKPMNHVHIIVLLWVEGQIYYVDNEATKELTTSKFMNTSA